MAVRRWPHGLQTSPISFRSSLCLRAGRGALTRTAAFVPDWAPHPDAKHTIPVTRWGTVSLTFGAPFADLCQTTGGHEIANKGCRMEQQLIEDISDSVATLTFNRPDRRNALSKPIMDGLLEALPRLAADPGVGVIVLTGAGRAFCAGGDVKSMADGAADRT